MTGLIEPGMWVRHPARPEWGMGQVQSVIGDRVTVNFEHAGKLLINAKQVELEIRTPDDRPG
jgi:FKBP-type peptidyl-prolyl cis-trans isomerase 2